MLADSVCLTCTLVSSNEDACLTCTEGMKQGPEAGLERVCGDESAYFADLLVEGDLFSG